MPQDSTSYMSQKKTKPKISSYQKGINKLLEEKGKFEYLIIEYVLSVNSKYNSSMFPTPQIAKISTLICEYLNFDN